MWSVLSQDSEIGCISRMNWWDELIFCMLVHLRKAKSYLNDFWVGIVRNRHSHLVLETLKSAVSKEWVHEFNWFFACWLWGSNFWLNQHHTLSFTFKCQSTAVVFFRPLAVAGRVPWNRVCPSFHPVVSWVVFLELDH